MCRQSMAIGILMSMIFGAGCATAPKDSFKDGSPEEVAAVEAMKSADKVAELGIGMLTPGSAAYNPAKGRRYLEHALRRGTIERLTVPAPVLLELIRGERVARQKTKALEQQLTTVKEIDLEREGKL